jgi:hypothetical protein
MPRKSQMRFARLEIEDVNRKCSGENMEFPIHSGQKLKRVLESTRVSDTKDNRASLDIGFALNKIQRIEISRFPCDAQSFQPRLPEPDRADRPTEKH